jgi:hypothetical protein
MSGTFKFVDYRLRPAKHAERTMLIDLYRQVQRSWNTTQYVGFGSVGFVDFRLVHKALGTSRLISIEEAEDDTQRERFRFNRPYDIIDLRFGHSNIILPQLDFTEPSIVWLDYDGLPSLSMINDLRAIARRVVSGSFIGVTFVDDFPPERRAREARLAELKDNFPDFVPDDANWKDFSGPNFSRFVRRMMGAFLDRALADADFAEQRMSDPRVAMQVCYFRYRDSSPMATLGWVVVKESELAKFEMCEFERLSFFRDAHTPFTIKAPVITTKEIQFLERMLPNIDLDDQSLAWLPREELEAFLASYRYLPFYAPIEAI